MDMYYCIIDNYIVQQVGCMWQQLYQSCDRCKMVSYDRSIVALSTVVLAVYPENLPATYNLMAGRVDCCY